MSQEIFFNFPQAGYLLFVLLPLVVAQSMLTFYRKKQQLSYAHADTMTRLLIPRSSLYTWTKTVGWMLIWIFACVALMQPFGNIRYPVPTTEAASDRSLMLPQYVPHEVIFLCDTSASMGVPDGSEGRTRLEEAKALMEDLMQQLNGQTVSLYAFTSELSAIVPPTVDYLFVRMAIRELNIDEGDVGGTRLAPVLKALQNDAFSYPSSKRYSVMMLTDGGDNPLESLTGEARDKEKEAILSAISNPPGLHLRLFTIGIGSLKPQVIPHVMDAGKPVESKLEETILKELAARNRGNYFRASDWTSWNLALQLKKEISEDPLIYPGESNFERKIGSATKENAIVDWYFQIPLGLAILFYLINLLLPDVRRT